MDARRLRIPGSLNSFVKAAARGVSRAVRQVPAGSRAIDRVIDNRRARAIVQSGLVDREFYEVQTNLRFGDDAAVVEHYLRTGRNRGLSLHPLFDEEWYRAETQAPFNDRFLSMFFGAEPLASTSPYFDAVVYADQCGQSGRTVPSTTREALEQFLRESDDETVLPNHGLLLSTWTLGSMRESRLSHLRTFKRHTRQQDDPRSLEWDKDRESDVIASLSARSMDRRPLVSIIMPVRDRESLIGEAIDSVRAQTYDNWELLVVDDGSTDGTGEVVESYDDDRISLVRQAPSGVCAARNNGARHASGEFVAFLDSDNSWNPLFLQLCIAGTEAHATELVYSGSKLIHGDGSESYLAFEADHDFLLYVRNFIDLNTVVVSKRLFDEVGGFDESLRRWVDYDLLIRLTDKTAPQLLHFIGVEYAHNDDASRITNREAIGWESVVVSKYLVDWDAAERMAPNRVPGLVSVVIPTFQDWEMTRAAVAAVLENSDGVDVEVIVVENGSAPQIQNLSLAIFGSHSRITFLPQHRNLNFSSGSNAGFCAARGEFTVFLNNDTTVEPGWLSPLVDVLNSDPALKGAQPLLLYPDGRVQAAGTVFAGGAAVPWHFMSGFAVSDVLASKERRFAAATAAALVMRSSEVLALRGFDPLFLNGFEDLDLCLRAGGGSPHAFAVVHESRVVHHESKTPGRFIANDQNRRTFFERWHGHIPTTASSHYERSGVRLDGYTLGPVFTTAVRRDTRAQLSRIAPLVATGSWTGKPALRWAIKIAAPGGPKGDRWGDTVFARDLATALRAQGQNVVVDHRESHQNPAESLEDVVLSLRGLDLVPPNPNAINLLWVISHPALVSDPELRAFDQVFAASTLWADRTSRRTGVDIRPLLQATSPQRFYPADPAPTTATGSGVVFVGNSRDVLRPVVSHALAADIPFSLHGGGWDKFIGSERIASEWLDEKRIAEVYRTSTSVLNDHWPDMAANGFISNRVFDAVASGAVVISDQVQGISDVFGSTVLQYATVGELQDQVEAAEKVTSAARAEAAADVHRLHSFEARATTLIETAYGLSTRS